MPIWQGRAQGCSASRWKSWGAWLLISIGRWTCNLAEQARLEALIRTVDTRELFYAARSLATVLAERALHALRLLEDTPLPEGCCIHRKQSSFSVQIHTERGLRLQHCLDEQTLAAVVDPCSYATSQALGREMRQLGIQAFEVPSARVPQEAPCVGVLTPYAFVSTPFDFQDWTLEVRADGVTFASFGQSQVVSLPREQFLVAGRWPGPEPKA